jgi:chemotaxis protein MotB
VVLTKKAERAIDGAQRDVTTGDAPAEPGAPAFVPSEPMPAAPDDPLPSGQLRQRLNIFEDGVLQFDQPAE